MCVVSGVFDTYRPIFPQPNIQPQTNPYPWVQPVVPGQKKYTIEDLAELIEAFRKSIELARKADEISGQPDCEDPDKASLEERVTEIERRLDELRDALS